MYKFLLLSRCFIRYKAFRNDSLLQLLEMLMLISVESLVSDNNEYADTKGADTNDNMKALNIIRWIAGRCPYSG